MNILQVNTSRKLLKTDGLRERKGEGGTPLEDPFLQNHSQPASPTNHLPLHLDRND